MSRTLRRKSPVRPGCRSWLLSAVALLSLQRSPAAEVNNKLVSRAGGESGSVGVAISANSHLTPDGRYVVFRSSASNLVANGSSISQIYLRDLQTSRIELVSITAGGLPGNGASYQPQISADGRYVVFTSAATDLVSGDGNTFDDIFCRDRAAGSTQRISDVPAALGGGQANDYSFQPRISGDGRFILFESHATNLIVSDTNEMGDGFIWDRRSGQIERVTLSSTGAELSGNPGGRCEVPALSDDGRFIVFQTSFAVSNAVPDDTNNAQDVFLRDRTLHTTRRISQSASGEQANASSFFPFISRDGSTIVFASFATNLVSGASGSVSNIFRYISASGELARITTGNGNSHQCTASSDGRFILFASDATDLLAADNNTATDQFLYDSSTSTLSLVSRASDGKFGNGRSGSHEIPGQPLLFGYPAYSSDDGRFVSYDSDASNLAVDDSNGASDVFVHDRQPPLFAQISGPSSALEGTSVILDGSASHGAALVFNWVQTAGPPLAAPSDPSLPVFSFSVPPLDSTALINVRLLIADAQGQLNFASADITALDSGGGSSTQDSDSDGFPDTLELTAETNAHDAASKPQPLVVSRLTMISNFVIQNKDSVTLSGALVVPEDLVLPELTVRINLAGVAQQLALDGKGRAPRGAVSFGARVKAPKGQSSAGGNLALKLGIKNVSFMPALSLPNETTRHGRSDVALVLWLGNSVYATMVPVSFKATKDKTALLKR